MPNPNVIKTLSSICKQHCRFCIRQGNHRRRSQSEWRGSECATEIILTDAQNGSVEEALVIVGKDFTLPEFLFLGAGRGVEGAFARESVDEVAEAVGVMWGLLIEAV